MSLGAVVAALLLALAAGSASLAAAGLVVLRGPGRRLHALNLAGIVAPLAVALAVVIDQPASSLALKALLLLAAILVAGPALTHATARAIHIRRRDEAQARERRS